MIGLDRMICSVTDRGIAAAVPPPCRHGEPALCGSHPLFTPY